jgi:beta-phosphoglucomutase-like phosphatase (HAD superfamily)
MKKISAVLFDLDGTLIDTEPMLVDAVRALVLKRGGSISRENALELVLGKSARDIYQEIHQAFPGIFSSDEEIESGIDVIYQKYCQVNDIFLPSSINLLRKLSQNFPIAIVSGSHTKTVEEAADSMGVKELLAFCLGADDYPIGKPDPGCFLKAASMLDIRPEECLVFEDSKAGVTSAKNAGMYCVGLKRPEAPDQDLSLADEIYEDLADFKLPCLEN